MSPFAGLPGLLRLAMRSERWWIGWTVAAFAGTYVATASQMSSVAPAVADRVALQQSMSATPAFTLLLGDFVHPDTVASTVSWRVGLFMAGVLAVLAVLTVVRHTRAEEEAGRTELLGAGRVGRLAPLAAAVTAALVMLVATCVASALALVGFGASAAQLAAYAVALALPSLAAIGLAAVAAEAATTARAAKGLAIGVVLLLYVVRGVTDLRGHALLTDLNPFGWVDVVDAFGSPVWWPVGAAVVTLAVLLGAATASAMRRDLGAGLLRVGAGPAHARGLRGVTTLEVRQTWRNLAGWSVVVALFGLFVGSVKPDLGDLAGSTPQIEEVLTSLGGAGAIVDAFTSVMAQLFGIAAACWAIAHVGSARAQESAGRLESTLATAASRRRVLLTTSAVAFTGVVVLQVTAALADGLVGGGLGDALAANLVRVPAAWLLAAVTVLLFAARPAWLGLGWLLAVFSVVAGPYGELFGVPDRLRSLSAFQHVPNVPVESVAWPPLVVMTLGAVAIVAVAVIVFDRRDVPASAVDAVTRRSLRHVVGR